MNEMDEDDLVEQVEANNELIQEAIRSSMMESIRGTDVSRASSTIQSINTIRIADTTDISL